MRSHCNSLGDRIQMDIRDKSLRKVFTRYMVYFCVNTVLLALMCWFTFSLLLQIGFILPANYTEQQLELIREDIETTEQVTKDIIPSECSYAVYDKSGVFLYGDFTNKEAKEAWNHKNNKYSNGWNQFYKVFTRNEEVCIVKYTIDARFHNTLLRKYLGSPTILVAILFIMIFVTNVLWLSRRFGKYFSNEMTKLMKITEEIKQQNLDFETEKSSISEINQVIDSMNQMKIALSDALLKQWNMEQLKRNQISALAHDIKTPLTIIKGNAELIHEISNNDEEQRCNNYILNSTKEIEGYIKMLIEMIKSEDTIKLNISKIDTLGFMEKIREQLNGIVADRQIQIEYHTNLTLDSDQKEPNEFRYQYFYADEDLLYRAILNVIVNAVEYCVDKGNIYISFCGYHNEISFTIEDSGKGFTKEDLKLATNQFYSGDKSRNNKNHYGMGLFIAKNFVALHNGILEISNSTTLKGAKVEIRIPVEKLIKN